MFTITKWIGIFNIEALKVFKYVVVLFRVDYVDYHIFIAVAIALPIERYSYLYHLYHH